MRTSFAVLIVAAFTVLFCVGVSHCQEIPDAPSACIDHGKPCPEWLHKLIGPYPVPPDQIYQWKQFDRAPDGLFTFRRLGAPVLRPNKKCWALFIGTHAALFAAYAVTNHKVEYPAQEVPGILGVTALDFAVFKLISPSLGMGAPVYGAVHYWNAR